MKDRERSLPRLFLLFVKIGAFTIGGGYVMIPLLQREFVERRGLIDAEDFYNIMAVAQSGPGGVAINSATAVGYKIRGLPGAFTATVGTVLPSFLAILILAFYLLKNRHTTLLENFLAGARPAVAGILIATSLTLGREMIRDKRGAALFAGGLLSILIFNFHPISVISAAGLMAYLMYQEHGKEEGKVSSKKHSRSD